MKPRDRSNGAPAAPAGRERRRAELLDAADRAVRRAGPAASMDSIAAEAGVTKPILYRHFGDKGGLYQALAERYASALMVELRRALGRDAEPRELLRTTIDTYLAFIARERRAYDFLMQRAVPERSEAHAVVAGFVRRVADEVAGVLATELGRYGLDTTPAGAWAHGLVGMVQLAGDWWLDAEPVPRGELVEQLVTLVWDGLATLVARLPRVT